MSSVVYGALKLMRKDGKIVDAVCYNNADTENVEILNIKKLKFEGKVVKNSQNTLNLRLIVCSS